jgi:Sec-independent protein secretion pathway component TatC
MYLNEQLQQIRVVLKDGKVLCMPLTLGTGVRPDYRVSETVSMMLLLSLAFAVGFQMPVFVLVLGWARIVSIEFLSKNRKYALFICSIVAALLTPADPFSMILMMIPLYALYELGILLLRWFPASKVAGNGPKRGEAPALPASDMEGAEGP